MNKLKNDFELFDVTVRRLHNGNKLKVVLEVPEVIDIEKKLIEFRGENVIAQITQAIQPTKKSDIIGFEGKFEVFDVKCRRLRNGNKLSLILEQGYDKKNEIALVGLRFQEVSVYLEQTEADLDFEEDESDDMLDKLDIDVEKVGGKK